MCWCVQYIEVTLSEILLIKHEKTWRSFTLSFGQARLGPKTTARLAAVILFISHLNIEDKEIFKPRLFQLQTCQWRDRETPSDIWGRHSSGRAASWWPGLDNSWGGSLVECLEYNAMVQLSSPAGTSEGCIYQWSGGCCRRAGRSSEDGRAPWGRSSAGRRRCGRLASESWPSLPG